MIGYLNPVTGHSRIEVEYAGEIALGSVQTGDKAVLDWVNTDMENDRN